MKLLLFFSLCLIGTSVYAKLGNNDSELFIQIKETGNYSIAINDDFISSRSGRFRFFDLDGGSTTVEILSNDKVVYKRDLNLREGKRLIATFSRRDGFRIVEDLDIYRRGIYVLDNWAGSIISHYDEPQATRPRPNPMVMRPEEFSGLLRAFRNESFDDDKLQFLNVALRNNRIAVTQLCQLLEEFSFEQNLLKAAISSYPAVYDKKNYYMVRNMMKFSSNKEKLDAFILRH